MSDFQPIVNSILSSVTYIIPCDETDDRHDCWLVDCGDVERVLECGYNVRGVLLTHVHFDHIYGLNRLLEAKPSALIYTNADGFEALQNPRLNLSHYHPDFPDFILSCPDSVRMIDHEGILEPGGGLKVEALFTPGHSPNCLSYIIGDCLFTGDAYIPGIETVTSFPRCNKTEALISKAYIKELEDQGFKVMPGHRLNK